MKTLLITLLSIFTITVNPLSSATRKTNRSPTLLQNLTGWFSNAAWSYRRTKQWRVRTTVYRSTLLQFAKLLQSNAKASKGALQQRLLGTVSALVDLHAHLNLLEGRIYQGQWQKRAGLNLRRHAPKAWQQMRRRINRARMEYYRIFQGHRARYLRKLFTPFPALLPDKPAPFLTGYRFALNNWLALNRLLDGRLKPQQFAPLWLRMLQGRPPEKKKKQ